MRLHPFARCLARAAARQATEQALDTQILALDATKAATS
jgi:hypothetical protein